MMRTTVHNFSPVPGVIRLRALKGLRSMALLPCRTCRFCQVTEWGFIWRE
jgi:hypothetical protein